jgi:UDP-N-acetyl-D-mannosaminuronic acid dehydrogenase
VDNLTQAIRDQKAKVAVIGLGYVGLPVACTFARVGFRVVGIERDEEKATQIGAGICPIRGDEPGLAELLADVIGAGKLRVATDYADCQDATIALIAVETPVESLSKEPSYDALRTALHDLGPNLRRGSLVIVESTIAPRTMERVVKPLLEETSGMKLGEGFYLAYCPERVMPGKLLANLRTCNRVIGGMSTEAGELARQVYRHIVEADLDITDALTAELVKTSENAYRDVQVAFANEIALLCENVGADAYQVRSLVNKSPYRDMHVPGAGVGGHCTPKDPWLLLYGTAGRLDAKLIPTARAINDGMPYHVAALAEEGLSEAGRPIRGAKVAVLGYAYLENTSDDRNSPTVPLVDRLQGLGAKVTIHDPHFPQYSIDLEEVVAGSDCVVVMVAHDAYRAADLRALRSWVSTAVLIDGRNVFDKAAARELGFIYKGVGNR